MPSRYEDWFRQAQRDISHAQHALEDGDYDWACFAAQQAAEKAVKALFRFLTADAWGQSVSLLLGRLPETYRPRQAIIDNGTGKLADVGRLGFFACALRHDCSMR